MQRQLRYKKQSPLRFWFNAAWWSATIVLFILALGCGASEDGDCAAGDTKQAEDGCNTCVCNEDGSWSCTERACPTPQCSPGDTSNDGCNGCTCNDSGLWICTQRACEPTEAQEGEACSMHGTQCVEGLECAYTCPDPSADPANCNMGINPSGTCVDANLECLSDADCMTAGCSGQVCQPTSAPAAITTCDYRPEYACYRPPTTNCQCNSGVCGWAQTNTLQSCLNNAAP